MMPGFVKGQVKILRYLMTCVSCVLNDVTLVNLAPNDIHTLHWDKIQRMTSRLQGLDREVSLEKSVHNVIVICRQNS